MASFLRRMSSRAKADTPAPAAADAPPPTIPPLEPFPVESLVARDLKITYIGSTDVTLQYSLPPTSTSADTVDIRVLVRPAKAYRTTQQAAAEVQKELMQLNMDYNMRIAKERTKPGFNQHEAFVAHTKQTNAVRSKLNQHWDKYCALCKELLNMDVVQQQFMDGWYLYNAQDRQFTGLDSSRTKLPLTLSSVSTESNNELGISNLASNMFFEVALVARNTNAPTQVNDAGEQTEWYTWGPMCPAASFSTKSAPWQSALEKAGLRHLIEPFAFRGLDTFDSWLQLADNTELKIELGIDSAMELILQDLLSANGVVTPAEQARIDRERKEMRGFVGNLLSELAVTKHALCMGDAVVDANKAKRFGVLTSQPQNGTVSVRWEDSRTKDPANSQVEQNVPVGTLKRSAFTLFMSHAQAEAQNQVAHLSVLLRDKEAKIWFDMDSERLEARDMVRGIDNSSTFLLYLTKSYLDRYFCRMELSVAKALEKPLVIVYEPDERFGGTSDYVKLVSQVTLKYPEFRDFLLSSEAIPMARRAFQRRAVVDEVCKRSGFAPAAAAEKTSKVTVEDADEVSYLRTTVLDLKMDINDLRAENKELREMIEALALRLDG